MTRKAQYPLPWLVALLAAASAGCSFVEVEPQGKRVFVARDAAEVAQCRKRGDIEVSVKDRVGFYERKALTVRDELATLARNEANRLTADTVLPITEPVDGSQRFAAYECSGRLNRGAAQSTAPRPATTSDGPEVFPIKD